MKSPAPFDGVISATTMGALEFVELWSSFLGAGEVSGSQGESRRTLGSGFFVENPSPDGVRGEFGEFLGCEESGDDVGP